MWRQGQPCPVAVISRVDMSEREAYVPSLGKWFLSCHSLSRPVKDSYQSGRLRDGDTELRLHEAECGDCGKVAEFSPITFLEDMGLV